MARREKSLELDVRKSNVSFYNCIINKRKYQDINLRGKSTILSKANNDFKLLHISQLKNWKGIAFRINPFADKVFVRYRMIDLFTVLEEINHDAFLCVALIP